MPEEKDTEEVLSKEELDEAFPEARQPFQDKDDEEKDTPPDSPPEEKTKEEEESPSSQGEESKSEAEEAEEEDKDTGKEKEVPFHKHPRWKAREKEWNERLSSLETDKDDLRAQLATRREQDKPEPIPTWFKGLYGDSPEMWEDYQTRVMAEGERIKKEIREEDSQALAEEDAEVKKWDSWVESEVSTLKADGLKFNRNELMKIALDYKPTDETGNISFKKAYDILQVLKESKKNPEKSKARKKLADATTPDSKAEPSPKGYKTPKDLEGGWPI